MRHQMMKRDGAVVAHQPDDVADMIRHRVVHIELALHLQPQNRRRREHLGHGRDVETVAQRQLRFVGRQHALAHRAVISAMRVGQQRLSVTPHQHRCNPRIREQRLDRRP